MNPIKLWVSYEKNLKKIGKAFKENMVQDKKTGVWKNKKMAIKELERKNRLLGKRCIQLLKDKGELTDQIADIKANCDLAIEGRDVKIKELEKQDKDLEWQLQEVAKDNDYYQAENKRLEKENAELKEQNSHLYNDLTMTEAENAERKAQLTKAKEIIKNLMLLHKYKTTDRENEISVFQQAGDFVKEIEK